MTIAYEIERLLAYGITKNLMDEYDKYAVRNALLDVLNVKEPYTGEETFGPEESCLPILENILDYCAQEGIIPDNSTTQRDLMDGKIMGLLMPRQSEVINRYNTSIREDGVEKAVENFYHMSQDSNYIRMDRIAKNMYWKGDTNFGDIEITINLSKPEKDPKEIERAKSMPKANYPKCLLCVENVGYAGRLNHPARQNHRVLPLRLNNEDWFFQYSPYVYYNEHSIIFRGSHTPMSISSDTFSRLLDFIESVPHYFIGSNADLPIVGGSILSHDHFQGGNHTFAMEVAPIRKAFTHKDYPAVEIGVVNWQMSVVRLASDDREQLHALATKVLADWRAYSDEKVGILSHSEVDGDKTPHNTITPISRKNKRGQYEIDLVLRNNRRTEEFPDGLFHPYPHLHHIKRENIGLIEVMGLAVLPGRLKGELELIKGILTNRVDPKDLTQEERASLDKHLPWIEELQHSVDNTLTEADAEALLRDQVSKKFSEVLECAGVYKHNEEGYAGFDRFMAHLGCN